MNEAVPAIAIEPYLSHEQLTPYRAAAAGDLEGALRLYEWNAQVGAAFLEVLGHLEIVLRNVMDRQLRVWHRSHHLPGQWYEDPRNLLDRYRHEDVYATLGRLRRDGKPETPGRVIAELPFGFWRFLLGKRYQNTLWAHALRRAFPGLHPQRRADVYDVVDRISRLRNRIAHHEPVHGLPLAQLHRDAVSLAEDISPAVARWIAGVSRVGAVLSAHP